MGNTSSLWLLCYPLIHLSTYPLGIFKTILTLFIFFLSILHLFERWQSTPEGPLKPVVWGIPKVLMGSTPSYCGEHRK